MKQRDTAIVGDYVQYFLHSEHILCSGDTPLRRFTIWYHSGDVSDKMF